jgi:nucleotide-binding universal stress UspA family protein
MINHVLFPLDDSLAAMMALDIATRILDSSCEIILLQVIEKQGVDSAHIEAQNFLDELASTLAEERGFHPLIRVEMGEPSEVIFQVADELRVDIIIMGSRNHPDNESESSDRLVRHVLKTATCPVLVISNGHVIAKA